VQGAYDWPEEEEAKEGQRGEKRYGLRLDGKLP